MQVWVAVQAMALHLRHSLHSGLRHAGSCGSHPSCCTVSCWRVCLLTPRSPAQAACTGCSQAAKSGARSAQHQKLPPQAACRDACLEVLLRSAWLHSRVSQALAHLSFQAPDMQAAHRDACLSVHLHNAQLGCRVMLCHPCCLQGRHNGHVPAHKTWSCQLGLPHAMLCSLLGQSI